ncbi:MAG: hypothetical protein IKB98_04505 [Clostridia bacterium]|nr:hypothetical protein [Clostridia bacterium]
MKEGNKYYMSVKVAEHDEFVCYQGYYKEAALNATANQNDYANKLPYWQRKWITETREFTLPKGKRWEDLDDDEQCDVLCNGYAVID